MTTKIAFGYLMMAEERRILSEGLEMTKLSDVLAEEWSAEYGCLNVGTDRDGFEIAEFRNPNGDKARTRSSVAALGKRALALILKHEWSDYESEYGGPRCPECEATSEYEETAPPGETYRKPVGIHTPDCELGKLVAEAKALG